MANKQQPDEAFQLAREQAAAELTEMRHVVGTLTPKMMVRKAMLLQMEDTSDGKPEDIENLLLAAIKLDSKCIEAYIELGRYYYAVIDDSQRAKSTFLTALELASDLNVEVIKGLLDCDAELQPDNEAEELRVQYSSRLLSGA